jgi:hypothetical protein
MLFIAVYGYILNGISTAYFMATTIFICMEVFLIWRHYSIHIEIKDNRWFINAGQGILGSYTADL